MSTETLTDNAGTTAQKYWGLLVRRPRWGLSWRGWLALAVLFALVAGAGVVTIHPFLAPTERLPTDTLVVEGWIHDYAFKFAEAEYRSGGYTRVFTTGGPVVGLGKYVNDFQTSASVGADRLKSAGVPGDRIIMVPSRVMGRDRTYSSAVALREWFRQQQSPPRRFNVLTEDAHARRTRLLFQKAFGDEAEIGVISVPDPDYDPKRWWRYSAGVRELLGETVAYVYARFFFHPSPSDGMPPPAAAEPRV